ncbi:uncharacterized protein [Miscanthus floridulus]|uniref:uncharacterized protein n=1 Tax=Miscanthus floridulus TaxID=154761 RepID=UPI00345A668F
MRPSRGFLSLGMRDMRSSPPPVPEDARWRAINRAHADAQKKRKDAKAAKRTKQLLAHEELDKRRRQQRKEGLPLEESPSTPALPGGGGEADPGSAVAGSRAEADTPETRVLGKRAVSPLGSAAVVEQAVVEATPPPLQRTEEAPGSIEDRLAPMDTEATPLPPPPPLRTRFAMAKRLPPRSSRKQPTDELPLAPLKALKASPGSSAHWVAEAQAAIQHGAASARVDPKGPAAQGGVAEAAPTQTREGALPPRGGEAHESDGASVPLVAEAPRVSEAKATEATAPTAAETIVATVGASTSAEATMAEAEAPETAEAIIAEGPPLLRESAREAEVYPISSYDTSQAREVVGTEETDAVKQPAPLLDEGNSALVWVRSESRRWDYPRILWRSRDDLEGEPLFTLEDAAEGGRWGTFEQYRRLAKRSLRTALSVVADELPGVAQDLETRSLGKSVFLRRERGV